MDMLSYLTEIEHATTSCLELVWFEQREIDRLTEIIKLQSFKAIEGYRRAKAFQEEDEDDDMLGTTLYWQTYFGPDKKHHYANDELQASQTKILVREFSRYALSANILQYAKQGISIVHGRDGLQVCPPGKNIGTQDLKTIIWQSRNQALHWEEGNPHQPVQKCFDLLKKEIDLKFADYGIKSMAFDIVNLLNWKNFSDFKNDMLTLA